MARASGRWLGFACGAATSPPAVSCSALKTTIAREARLRGRVKAALRVVTPLLEEPLADRRNWTIPRLRAEIEAREGVRISRSQLSKALRKKFRWRLAHAEGTLRRKARWNGWSLRLQLRKQQAEAGDIVPSLRR